MTNEEAKEALTRLSISNFRSGKTYITEALIMAIEALEQEGKILDIIHKTIYQFFDVCGDDEETPMSDKDKLLLEVNKAICNNIKVHTKSS